MKELVFAVVWMMVGAVAFSQVRQGAWTPVVESMERGYSSISYWTYRDDGVEIGGGRISVEHGKPAWPAMLDETTAFDAATLGKLWRLGNNKWTSFDTQLKVRFGDRVVEPGIYYLVLERSTGGDWGLVFVNPADVSPRYIDAWAAQARPGEVPRAFDLPLDYAVSDEASPTLDMQLGLSPDEMSDGTLTIQWGKHQLSTAFTIDVPPATFYRSERDPR